MGEITPKKGIQLRDANMMSTIEPETEVRKIVMKRSMDTIEEIIQQKTRITTLAAEITNTAGVIPTTITDLIMEGIVLIPSQEEMIMNAKIDVYDKV